MRSLIQPRFFVTADRSITTVNAACPITRCLTSDDIFTAGAEPCIVDVAGARIGVAICEDIWEADPCDALSAAGAKLIVSINGSPFKVGKQALRERVIQDRCRTTGLPIVYQNMVGGQDELVFDGGSAVFDAEGKLVRRAPDFREGLYPCEFRLGPSVTPVPGDIAPIPDGSRERVYRACYGRARLCDEERDFRA